MEINSDENVLEVCRTCLQPINNTSEIFYLNSVDHTSMTESTTIGQKLNQRIPELYLHITPNAAICSDCYTALDVSHKFRKKCLQTQERINCYVQKMSCTTNWVNLRQIVRENQQKSSYGEMVDDCEMEEPITTFSDGFKEENTSEQDSIKRKNELTGQDLIVDVCKIEEPVSSFLGNFKKESTPQQDSLEVKKELTEQDINIEVIDIKEESIDSSDLDDCQSIPENRKVEKQRWGNTNVNSIDTSAQNINIPINTSYSTTKNKEYVWRQFMNFCVARNYELTAETSTDQLSSILKDWALNMKKSNGDDYKESVVKTLWNTVAKLLQEKFFNDYHIKFDPFTDIEFQQARNARDAKRKQLRIHPEKRKCSVADLTLEESIKMKKFWNENTPEGLLKKFYIVVAAELGWRGHEGAFALMSHFREEFDNYGNPTGRIEYNPIFSETTQGGSQRCSDSKWLIKNLTDLDICPVRLFNKLLQNRPGHVTTECLFLTPNPRWQAGSSRGWYKNKGIGVKELSKWTKQTAVKIGLDTKKRKRNNQL